MNMWKGKLIDLKDTGKEKKQVNFSCFYKRFDGLDERFLTLTKGTGIINRIFHSFGEYTGDMEGRRNEHLFQWKMEKL